MVNLLLAADHLESSSGTTDDIHGSLLARLCPPQDSPKGAQAS